MPSRITILHPIKFSISCHCFLLVISICWHPIWDPIRHLIQYLIRPLKIRSLPFVQVFPSASVSWFRRGLLWASGAIKGSTKRQYDHLPGNKGIKSYLRIWGQYNPIWSITAKIGSIWLIIAKNWFYSLTGSILQLDDQRDGGDSEGFVWERRSAIAELVSALPQASHI